MFTKNLLFFDYLLNEIQKKKKEKKIQKKKKEKIVTSQARNNCRPNFIMVSDKSFNKSRKNINTQQQKIKTNSNTTTMY